MLVTFESVNAVRTPHARGLLTASFTAFGQHQFPGAESTIRRHMGQRRTELEPPEACLVRVYGPGVDAQCDCGEAEVVLAGQAVAAQFFCLRV